MTWVDEFNMAMNQYKVNVEFEYGITPDNDLAMITRYYCNQWVLRYTFIKSVPTSEQITVHNPDKWALVTDNHRYDSRYPEKNSFLVNSYKSIKARAITDRKNQRNMQIFESIAAKEQWDSEMPQDYNMERLSDLNRFFMSQLTTYNGK